MPENCRTGVPPKSPQTVQALAQVREKEQAHIISSDTIQLCDEYKLHFLTETKSPPPIYF
uniref:Uncharacterized protein n=1 Tax=Anguilla anguilla TaxID=7936 RepID=A0A0E9SS06_ANGAN